MTTKTIAQQLNIKSFPLNIYDDKGNKIYLEYSNGYWQKRQYNDKENVVYYEDSTGYWEKRQYDEKDNRIYYEDSTGNIIDKRPKQTVEITLDEIATKFNIPVEQLKIKK